MGLTLHAVGQRVHRDAPRLFAVLGVAADAVVPADADVAVVALVRVFGGAVGAGLADSEGGGGGLGVGAAFVRLKVEAAGAEAVVAGVRAAEDVRQQLVSRCGSWNRR